MDELAARIQACIERNRDEILNFLSEYIQQDSTNPALGENCAPYACHEWLADRLERMQLFDKVDFWKLDGGFSNVVAVKTGEGEPLMFAAHSDTVPVTEAQLAAWNREAGPLSGLVKDGNIYGRGASDMKSGLAVLLAAFKRRAMENRIPRRGIWFVGTCDEEASGLGARAALNQIHGRVSALLIGEPTAGEIGLAAKGCIWLKLRGSGRTSHGAYPERGVDAIGHLTAVVDGICAAYFSGEAAHPLLGRATCTLTQISGGIKANMVADRAEAMLDIRTLPCMAHGTLLNGIRKLCADYCAAHPGFAVEMEIENLRPPVETEPNSPLAACLRACIQEAQSVPARETGTAFFSDASILRDLGVQDIILFGPGDPTLAHVPNEYVELEACEWALSIVNRVLDQFCG